MHPHRALISPSFPHQTPIYSVCRPKDPEEWKKWVKAALPWLAGLAIAVAATNAMRRPKDDERGEGVGDVACRKAKRDGDKAEEAWEEGKESARRRWFGWKRRAEGAADEAGDRLEDAKATASRKVSRGEEERVL